MTILVVNLGSTSFKFKLYSQCEQRGSETLLAQGGVERVGSDQARVFLNQPVKTEQIRPVVDHADAVAANLDQLRDSGAVASLDAIDAIGFKAVHGGPISGAVQITDEVLATMQAFADVTPAHNPMYMTAMRAFAQRYPAVPLVACFETAFHQTMPPERSTYAIPWEWTHKLGVRRYGFHGASHRYLAERTAALLGRTDARVISCHLGGSSSVCAIDSGASVANSFGLAPQSGLPHNNRVGDLDAYAILKLRAAGLSESEIWDGLSKRGGLLGISGVSNDLRDIEAAVLRKQPATPDESARSELAIRVLIRSICDYIGAYLMQLGGADMIALTGGIGENSKRIQAGILQNLSWLGVQPDLGRLATDADAAVALLPGERPISAAGCRPAVWVVPTNEELTVARLTAGVLTAGGSVAPAGRN